MECGQVSSTVDIPDENYMKTFGADFSEVSNRQTSTLIFI